MALADGRGRLRSGWTASPWRWALPAAVALTVALIAVSAWLSKTPAGDGPRVVVTAPAPTSAPLSPRLPRSRRTGRGAATVVPTPDAPRCSSHRDLGRPNERRISVPDPLVALVRAVEGNPRRRRGPSQRREPARPRRRRTVRRPHRGGAAGHAPSRMRRLHRPSKENPDVCLARPLPAFPFRFCCSSLPCGRASGHGPLSPIGRRPRPRSRTMAKSCPRSATSAST